MSLRFKGKPYESCRQMGCYGATLGKFCAAHAGSSDERLDEQIRRAEDIELREWASTIE